MKAENNIIINEYRGNTLSGQPLSLDEGTIIYCEKGGAEILFNEKIYTFESQMNFILLDSSCIHFNKCSDDFILYTIKFGIKIINRIYTHLDSRVVDLLKINSLDIPTAADYIQSCLTLKKILLLNKQESNSKSFIMRHLILCYLLEISDIIYTSMENKDNTTANSLYVDNIIKQFIMLCKDEHKKHREVEFYSKSLNISRRYLNKIVSNKLNTTPKAIIDGYVITTIKRLLISTDKSNMTISEEMGFPDQSTFVQYFKRIIKMTPTEFRRTNTLF